MKWYFHQIKLVYCSELLVCQAPLEFRKQGARYVSWNHAETFFYDAMNACLEKSTHELLRASSKKSLRKLVTSTCSPGMMDQGNPEQSPSKQSIASNDAGKVFICLCFSAVCSNCLSPFSLLLPLFCRPTNSLPFSLPFFLTHSHMYLKISWSLQRIAWLSI